MKKIPQQLIPLAVLFPLFIIALMVARSELTPDTFGDLGHYRAAAVADNAGIDITYVGAAVCGDCHDEIEDSKASSHHDPVSCETCHGPGASHIDDPDESTPRIPRSRRHCQLCHEYNQSRPSGFPQILPDQHNPGKPCIECHDPHKPVLPHTPGDCGACHRVIVLQKSVSHHASLECTRCHAVSPEHVSTPRAVQAGKPGSNDLCSECHGQGSAESSGIPQIDVASHAGRYHCWDCHYPHFPEANR